MPTATRIHVSFVRAGDRYISSWGGEQSRKFQSPTNETSGIGLGLKSDGFSWTTPYIFATSDVVDVIRWEEYEWL